MRRAPSRRIAPRELIALPVFVVGRRTAEAARAAGFRDVHSADGDKADLGALIARAFARDRCGRCFISPARIAPAISRPICGRRSVHTAVVYRAVKSERFRAAVAAALAAGGIDGVLHFSAAARRPISIAPRAAASSTGRLRRCIFACRARWRSRSRAGAADIRVAARPDEAALLELVGAA